MALRRALQYWRAVPGLGRMFVMLWGVMLLLSPFMAFCIVKLINSTCFDDCIEETKAGYFAEWQFVLVVTVGLPMCAFALGAFVLFVGRFRLAAGSGCEEKGAK